MSHPEVEGSNPSSKSGRLIAYIRSFPMTSFLFALILIFYVWSCSIGVNWLSPSPAELFKAGGQLGTAIYAGDTWRLLMAGFLHAGILHLLVNSYALIQIGPVAERLVGRPRLFIFYIASLIGGTTLSALSNPFVVSVGASGAIFGIFGMILAAVVFQKASLSKEELQYYSRSAIPFIIINLLPRGGVDIAAHFGGLAVGFLLAAATFALIRPVFAGVTLGLVASVAQVYGFLAIPPKEDAKVVIENFRFEKTLVKCLQVEAPEDYANSFLKTTQSPDCFAAFERKELFPRVYEAAFKKCESGEPDACAFIVSAYEAIGAFDEAIALTRPECEKDANACSRLGAILLRSGKAKESIEFTTRSCAAEKRLGCYDIACAYCVLGEKEKAMTAITDAVRLRKEANNPLDAEKLKRDGDLKCIHDDPRFVALVQGMAK